MRNRLASLLVVVLGLGLPVAGGALVASCKPKVTKEVAPTLVVRDDSQGFLFTWIDAKGNFHVETSAKEVPLEGRDAVRVLDPSKEDGSHDDRVFIADLRNAQADGTYVVHVATRAEFDQLAEQRRLKNGVALAPIPSATGPLAAHGAGDEGTGAESNRPKVIIYGASWCHACHEAARYLDKRHIAYVEKDIEENAGAAKEMNDKLRAAGRRGGSIPVLDVRGTVLIGFSPDEVERALGKAS